MSLSSNKEGNFIIQSSFSIFVKIFGLAPPDEPPNLKRLSKSSEYSVFKIFLQDNANLHDSLYLLKDCILVYKIMLPFQFRQQ